ncbi:AAA family ATPase [Streptomyces sannanensis]|uniref:AAA family ATPase n=1 Tax=Streptomyces sannanensis TaxID=285536 RepID=UPI003CD0A260
MDGHRDSSRHRAAKREPTRHRSLQRCGRRESPSFTGARMSRRRLPRAAVRRAGGPVIAAIPEELIELIADGRSAVLDHGLLTRKKREERKNLVREAGGQPRLLYFPVPRDELLLRLGEQPASGRQRLGGRRISAGRLLCPIRASPR